ncbi:restriction endonuclease [Hyphomonas adhaerens]|uniref:restriction endonuclease n=1 Tax=Hyphomonas adhaerens TaxID=81029 RepID=UPI0023554E4F|nr:restriction endonuclease [Hyphomonas adhaerens]|tara:strand:+ start:1266 stop:2192 length:927 start_codon:yes stop_codon:yes gene_type:complete
MNNIPPNKRFQLGKDGLPDLPLLMLITLDALRALGGSATIQELLDYVIEHEGITEDEQSYLMPNGRDRRLNYYLSWARTYLKRGGAVENSARGVWALTETGEHMSALTETQRIHTQVNEEERQRAKAKRNAERKATTEDAASTSVEIDVISSDDDEEDWQDALLSELMKIDPSAFERLAQRLLREAGFVKVEVRGKTGDGGIDGVGILRVNLVSFQVYFQCKRWSNSIGAKEIRDFRGALQGRADKGLFITTSSFTKQASDEATRDGAIAIDLIDGERLCELLKEYELGVKTETVERVTVQSKWLSEI